MKIGICGKIASGKTTFANLLVENYGFQKFSFATAVKQFATEICGMNPEKKDRELLQKIGHEGRRLLFEDVWVETVMRKTKKVDLAIVDDVRYINEFNALKNNGWIMIKLNISSELQEKRIRETYPDNFQQHLDNLTHPSETEMDEINIKAFDYSINVDDQDCFDKFFYTFTSFYLKKVKKLKGYTNLI